MRERHRLIAGIREIRRVADAADRSTQRPPVVSEQDRLPALEARITELEQLVQGLQDSVHREFSRRAKQIAEVEARIQPAALGRALSEDARDRGL